MADREKGFQWYIIIHVVFGCLVQCWWIYPNTHLNFLNNQYQQIKPDLYGATLHRGRQNTDIVSHVSVSVLQKAVTYNILALVSAETCSILHNIFNFVTWIPVKALSKVRNITEFYFGRILVCFQKGKYYFWIVIYFLTISSVTSLYYMGLFEKTFILTVWHYFEQPDTKNE